MGKDYAQSIYGGFFVRLKFGLAQSICLKDFFVVHRRLCLAIYSLCVFIVSLGFPSFRLHCK